MAALMGGTNTKAFAANCSHPLKQDYKSQLFHDGQGLVFAGAKEKLWTVTDTKLEKIGSRVNRSAPVWLYSAHQIKGDQKTVWQQIDKTK